MKRTAVFVLALSLSAMGAAWAQPVRCAMMQRSAPDCSCCDAAGLKAPAQLSCQHGESAVHALSLAADVQKASQSAPRAIVVHSPIPSATIVQTAAALAFDAGLLHAPPKRFLLACNFRL